MAEATLVSLADFKEQLAITWEDQDERLKFALRAAEDFVLNHIKVARADLDWTAETVPGNIAHAIILVGRAYFYDSDKVLSENVINLLVGYRDPTLA